MIFIGCRTVIPHLWWMFLADASGCHLVGDMMHTGVTSVRRWDRRRGSLEELDRVGGGVHEGKKHVVTGRWAVNRDVEGT